MKKIYEYSRSPPFLIVEDEEGYWLVPARSGGWEDRAPFFGRVSGLREVTASSDMADLGLPPGE